MALEVEGRVGGNDRDLLVPNHPTDEFSVGAVTVPKHMFVVEVPNVPRDTDGMLLV
jgi:hypothetical protein